MILITKFLKSLAGKQTSSVKTREMTKEESEAFDAAFKHFDKAFGEMEKLFEKWSK